MVKIGHDFYFILLLLLLLIVILFSICVLLGYVVGDLHGDLKQTRLALEMAGVLGSDTRNLWTGGQTVSLYFLFVYTLFNFLHTCSTLSKSNVYNSICKRFEFPFKT